MRSASGLLLALFTLGFLGCSSSPEPVECSAPEGAGEFEAGTGEVCFERVEDGGTIPLMEGPQGGWHIWLAVGCTDCGTSAHLRAVVTDPTDGEEVVPNTEVFADLSSDAWPQIAGLQLSMPDPYEVGSKSARGTPLAIHVEVLDLETSEVLHEVELSAVLGGTQTWDPCDTNPDGPDCCEDCFGEG